MVIVSKDTINDTAYPVAVPIERGSDHVPGLVLPLAEQDPMAGVVNINMVAVVDPVQLGEPIGTITGSTLVLIVSAVQSLFEMG